MKTKFAGRKIWILKICTYFQEPYVSTFLVSEMKNLNNNFIQNYPRIPNIYKNWAIGNNGKKLHWRNIFLKFGQWKRYSGFGVFLNTFFLEELEGWKPNFTWSLYWPRSSLIFSFLAHQKKKIEKTPKWMVKRLRLMRGSNIIRHNSNFNGNLIFLKLVFFVRFSINIHI